MLLVLQQNIFNNIYIIEPSYESLNYVEVFAISHFLCLYLEYFEITVYFSN